MAKEICGVYCIENLVNHKKYIGQSVSIEDRWSAHKSELRANKHYNDYLQKAWNKYGENNFEFTVIEECDPIVLDEREIYYIKCFQTLQREYGYNLTDGGNANRHVSDETRQKMSESLSGKIRSEEHRRHLSESKLGKNTGEDNPFYGHHHTEETKEILKNKARQRYQNKEDHPCFGKRHSEESKEKMRQRKLGKKASAETKAKLSEMRKGQNNPRANVPIYCPELDESFWGAKEAQDKYGFDRNSISACIHGKLKHTGKHPITGEPLSWQKIEK